MKTIEALTSYEADAINTQNQETRTLVKEVHVIRMRLRLPPIAAACAVAYIAGSVFAPTIAFACSIGGGLGALTPSQQPLLWLGIGKLEAENFNYEEFPVGAKNEEAKLGATTIEQTQIPGKTGKFEIKNNKCENKTIATGFGCLVEIEYTGQAESLKKIEGKVCAFLVQPYKGESNPNNGSAAKAKLNCEK